MNVFVIEACFSSGVPEDFNTEVIGVTTSLEQAKALVAQLEPQTTSSWEPALGGIVSGRFAFEVGKHRHNERYFFISEHPLQAPA